jgi:sigma-B regulation protein RsbU (phosphoserine phosphatase)
MSLTAAEMSYAELLRTFQRDAPYLFLGAAFVAVGVVSAMYVAIRRKIDLLLIDFALFAFFYGLRLWLRSALVALTLHDFPFYIRLRFSIDYIILILHFCSSFQRA